MNLLRLFFSILLVLSFNFLSAQQDESPYKWKKKESIMTYTMGTSILGVSFFVGKKTKVLSETKIQLLDKKRLPSFDRIATTFSSEGARKTSDIFGYSSVAACALLFSSEKIRKDFWKIGNIYGQVFLLNIGLTNLTKTTVLRSRPLVYNSDFALSEKRTKNARYSFFSGHTSFVSSNCFFAAKVFSDYFPNSNWRYLTWSVAATIPAITGYLRVRAGKHFPSDVAVGYIVGGGIGILIPYLHKVFPEKINENLSFSLMPTGGYFCFRF